MAQAKARNSWMPRFAQPRLAALLLVLACCPVLEMQIAACMQGCRLGAPHARGPPTTWPSSDGGEPVRRRLSSAPRLLAMFLAGTCIVRPPHVRLGALIRGAHCMPRRQCGGCTPHALQWVPPAYS